MASADKVKDFIIQLDHCIGRRGRVETTEGIYRPGVLTGIRWRKMLFQGQQVLVPHELILDKDEADPIPFGHLIAISFPPPVPAAKPAK